MNLFAFIVILPGSLRNEMLHLLINYCSCILHNASLFIFSLPVVIFITFMAVGCQNRMILDGLNLPDTEEFPNFFRVPVAKNLSRFGFFFPIVSKNLKFEQLNNDSSIHFSESKTKLNVPGLQRV